MSSKPTSRAVRQDYQAMNDGSDDEGDISDGSNRRSRRQIESTQSKLTFAPSIEPSVAIPDDIQPNESASQVLTDSFDDSSLVERLESSLLYKKERKPRNKRSELWDEFHTVDLETEYLHKATRKMKPDKLITCKRCSWNTFNSILQGSTSNLNGHLKGDYRIDKFGTRLPSIQTSSSNSNIKAFLVLAQPQPQTPN